MIAENTGKTTDDCVKILISTLRKLQYGLTDNLRSDAYLFEKILIACKGVSACRAAILDPPSSSDATSNLAYLMNKLSSSISTFEAEEGRAQAQAYFTSHGQNTPPEALLTDRRYYYRNPRPTRGGYGRDSSRFRNRNTTSTYATA